MGSPWIGDRVSVVIDGETYTRGRTVGGQTSPKIITVPQTWTTPEVDIYGASKETRTIEFIDEDDHVEYLKLRAVSDAKLPVSVTIYPLGNVAGELVQSGTAYVNCTPLDIGVDKATTFTVSISFTAVPTETPNLALSVTDFGSTGQGDASAYVAPTASGGTSTYTIEMEDENGDASALPYGITWTGSAFTGTVNAAAPIGIYRVKVKVTDSAAAPVIKYFDCTMEVVA